MLNINKSLPSFCTSNEDVIDSIILFCKKFNLPVLIESTSNQVNQFGGYSNLNPKKFKSRVIQLAKKNYYPKNKIIFGGDHLGPLPWKKLDKVEALKRGQVLVNLYLDADFKKLHIDTTIKLVNDFNLTKNSIKERSKRILSNLNKKKIKNLIIVLGSEVPPAGGEKHQRKIHNNNFHKVISEIKIYRKIFEELNLNNKLNLVVDPGASFDDNKITLPNTILLNKLKKISKKMSVKYEAHSTDYQNLKELKKLVLSNFKYLKVGPELTYNFTRAILKMESIEKKYSKKKSKIEFIIFKTLKKKNKYWIDYYKSNELKKIVYGQYDRLRYYWNEKNIMYSKKKLFSNINKLDKKIIFKELGFNKNKFFYLNSYKIPNTKIIINFFLYEVLKKYYKACNFKV